MHSACWRVFGFLGSLGDFFCFYRIRIEILPVGKFQPICVILSQKKVRGVFRFKTALSETPSSWRRSFTERPSLEDGGSTRSALSGLERRLHEMGHSSLVQSGRW